MGIKGLNIKDLLRKIIMSGKLSKIKKFITNRNYRFIILANKGFFKSWDDERYLKREYFAQTGKVLNLNPPVTFNEKLQWLKLHDRNPLYTTLVDKYTVKDWVAERIGKEHIIPTLGVWDKFDDIDFSKLPEQFVLKCTHDSGGLVIVTDKLAFLKNEKGNGQIGIKSARKIINKFLRRKYFYIHREWPYKNVKPRIIAEKYMVDEKTSELRDYKFFAFNGLVKALFIATDRQNPNEETKFDFFDADFRHLDIHNGHPNADIPPAKPERFEEMKAMAAKLSEKFPQLRVDFYEVNGSAYFGELTFSHWAGLKLFEPESWDKTFGDWIKLPEINGGVRLYR